MATQIGIGFSRNPNALQAVREASAQIRSQTGHAPINLLIIFNTIQLNSTEIISTLRNLFEETQIIGCSTAGVILNDFLLTQGLAILAIQSDEIKFGVSNINHLNSPDIRQIGNLLARGTLTDFGTYRRQLFISFTDGLFKNCAPIVKGLQEVFGTFFPIIGAGSSDDFYMGKTYQYCQKDVMTNGIAGLLIGGTVTIGIGNRHGWNPLGRPRVITQVDGNVIKSIDGKKAISLYEEYFGNQSENLKTKQLGSMAILYPLGIYLEEEREYLLRNAVDILDDGSIVCQGEVPLGATVHIMIGSKDSCKKAAIDAALEAKQSLKGKEPKLAIIFESLARHKLLGRAAPKEIQLIKDILGHHTPLIGMYSFGEIAPFHSLEHSRKTHLQNASIVILAIA